MQFNPAIRRRRWRPRESTSPFGWYLPRKGNPFNGDEWTSFRFRPNCLESRASDGRDKIVRKTGMAAARLIRSTCWGCLLANPHDGCCYCFCEMLTEVEVGANLRWFIFMVIMEIDLWSYINYITIFIWICNQHKSLIPPFGEVFFCFYESRIAQSFTDLACFWFTTPRYPK